MEYKLINGVPDLRHCNWVNEETNEAYHTGVLTKSDVDIIGRCFGDILEKSGNRDWDLCFPHYILRNLYAARMGYEFDYDSIGGYKELLGGVVFHDQGKLNKICFKDIAIALEDPIEAELWENG